MKIQNYSINSFIPIKKSSVAYVEKQKQIENKATVPFYNFIPSLKAQLSFGSSIPIDLNIFCKKHGKVTQKEFERIKKLHPSMIQKAYELLNERYNGEITPNKVASSAILFKNYLDKKYDGNYRIISVGTSPYQIAQAMQYLGSNVAYIPISCLSAYNFDDENSKYQNLEISLKYLEEQLNQMPHDENTKDIILDYFNTGKTINNLWTILVERGFETQDSLIGMPVDTLFEEFKRKRTHMAIVQDKEEKTLGIVTMEDILEEIVGEIFDEHDVAPTSSIVKQKDGSFLVGGDCDTNEFLEFFNIESKDEDEYQTINGYLVAKIGYIPLEKEEFNFEGLKYLITKADEKMILEFKVEKGENE